MEVLNNKKKKIKKVVKALKKLKNPVSLEKIKNNSKLKNIALIKQSRLSVMPLKKIEWDEILKLSK